jgi:hypothetical protein
MSASDQEREEMRRCYREQVRKESESNAQRWSMMTPLQRTRYPEASHE